jgi:hypothetical protein
MSFASRASRQVVLWDLNQADLNAAQVRCALQTLL